MTPPPDLRKWNPGRPNKLTKEGVRLYLEAVGAGAFRDTAAAYAGWDRHTVNEWLKRGARYRQGVGRDGNGRRDPRDKKLAEFHAAVEAAEAHAERDLTSLIQKAAEGSLHEKLAPDWRAAESLLKRRFRERWADKIEVHQTVRDVSAPDAGTDKLTAAVLDDKDLARQFTGLLSEIAKRSRPKKDPEE